MSEEDVHLSRAALDVVSTPKGYARVRLGMDPYKWQDDCLDALAEPYSNCAVRTCNESGKTSVLIASAILWHMECYPGSLVVTTSASNKQIKFQLYPQLKRLTARWDGWSIRDSNEYSVKAPNGSICVSYSTDDPSLIEGFHEWPKSGYLKGWEPPEDLELGDYELDDNAPLMIIVDEGKSIQDVFFDALDRCRPTRYLVASSPGEPIGRFYDFFYTWKDRFKNDDGTFNIFSASYKDCPHLYEDKNKRKWIEQDILLRGRDDAFVRSSAFGEFAQSGSNMVFNMFKVDESMSGMIKHYDSDTIRYAVDLSGGGDETVGGLRRGNTGEIDFLSHESDAVLLAHDLIIRFQYHNLKAHQISVDDGGLGDPICDYLASKGWSVNRVKFGGRAKNPEKYLNVRSEMFFELSQNVTQGNIALPRDDQLREQLGWQKYRLGEDQKLALLAKKYMPKSPDRADTMAMLFYSMTSVTELVDVFESHGRMMSATLPSERRHGFSLIDNTEGADEGLLY